MVRVTRRYVAENCEISQPGNKLAVSGYELFFLPADDESRPKRLRYPRRRLFGVTTGRLMATSIFVILRDCEKIFERLHLQTPLHLVKSAEYTSITTGKAGVMWKMRMIMAIEP
jgi:hypothetical protein